MTNLEYRPIPPEHFDSFAHHHAGAFGGSLAKTREWLEEEHFAQPRGIYADGKLVAQLMYYPFELSTGFTNLAFGGIGSVSSPPESRRRGYVARLLRELAAELHERGTFLTVLQPFSARYYRQFGYAFFEERRRYRGAIAALSHFRRERAGQWELVNASQISELDAVYQEALRGRFGPIIRPEAWWRNEILHLNGETHYAYLWRDGQGKVRTYCLYRWGKHEQERLLDVRECVALDPEARAQLFGFMADHDNQTRHVSFPAPADAPIQALMTEQFSSTTDPYFMLRLHDVAAALSAYRYPGAVEGRLTLAITDDWHPENQGVYALELAKGQAEVKRLPEDTAADLACDVRVLTQLYARYLRPRSAATFGLIDVHQRPALALLDAMFAGLAPFCADAF